MARGDFFKARRKKLGHTYFNYDYRVEVGKREGRNDVEMT